MIENGSSIAQQHEESLKERRKRTAITISLITGILMVLISVISTVATITTGLNSYSGILLTSFLAIAAFVCAYLCKIDKTTVGVSILLGSILFLSLSLPVIAEGQGVAFSVTVAIIVTSIAFATLPPVPARNFTIAGICVGVLIALGDMFLPNMGFPTDPRFATAFSILISIIYTFSLLRRFNTYNLRTKLIISFVLVTIIPLATLGIYNNFVLRNTLTAATEQNLVKVAKDASNYLDAYINSQLDAIRTESQQIGLEQYLQSSAVTADQTTAATETLQTFLRKDPVFITSYALLDENGVNVLDTIEANIGSTEEAGQEYFKAPMQNGFPYVSDIVYASDGTASIYFSAPVRDANGKKLGILRAEYNAGILQSIVNSLTYKESALGGLSLTLLDKEYYVSLADTANRDNLYKSWQTLTNQQLVELQAAGKIPVRDAADSIAPEAAILAILTQGETPVFRATSNSLGEPVIVTSVPLTTFPWIMLARQTENVALAPVEQQSRTLVLVSMLLIGLASLAGYMAAQALTVPIINLTQTAELVAGGDRQARAKVTSLDEIGMLATTFNAMADQLNETLSNLEKRVAIRTAELEEANLKTEKRVMELQAISDVARAISVEQNLSKLLPLVTSLVSERFGFYHVGIFLLDIQKRFAILQAANSIGGQRMLERRHRLEVGQKGLVGFASQAGKARIALDVGEDAVFFNNPDLPSTRSEIALPLKSHNEIIGVLDVQSEEAGAFTEEDAKTLEILADQIAIAIENARLITRTRNALEQSDKIFQQYVAENWQNTMQERNSGYQFSGLELEPILQPIRSPEIVQALTGGEIVDADKSENNSITVPVKLGNQVIGVLNATPQSADKSWNEHEIIILRSVAERIAIALENARLVEEAQKRAGQERIISEFSTRISTATDIESILDTTLTELGKNITGANVIIQLNKPGNKK